MDQKKLISSEFQRGFRKLRRRDNIDERILIKSVDLLSRWGFVKASIKDIA